MANTTSPQSDIPRGGDVWRNKRSGKLTRVLGLEPALCVREDDNVQIHHFSPHFLRKYYTRVPELCRNIGESYMHPEKGKCIFIAVHPHDGACLVMEQEDREDGEICHFFICERDELSSLEGTPSPPEVYPVPEKE